MAGQGEAATHGATDSSGQHEPGSLNSAAVDEGAALLEISEHEQSSATAPPYARPHGTVSPSPPGEQQLVQDPHAGTLSSTPCSSADSAEESVLRALRAAYESEQGADGPSLDAREGNASVGSDSSGQTPGVLGLHSSPASASTVVTGFQHSRSQSSRRSLESHDGLNSEPVGAETKSEPPGAQPPPAQVRPLNIRGFQRLERGNASLAVILTC